MQIPDGIIYAGIPLLAGAVGWVVSSVVNRDKSTLAQIHTVNQDLYRLIAELKEDNEKCELEHSKTKLELDEVKRQIGFRNMLRGKVYILDDDQDDLDEFSRELDSISIINYKGYRKAQEFIKDCQHDQPEIVVMDHVLEGKQTAKDIINVLGYPPEILIMSGGSNFAAEYENMKVKFFVKEGKYQLRIIATIIDFLSKK